MHPLFDAHCHLKSAAAPAPAAAPLPTPASAPEPVPEAMSIAASAFPSSVPCADGVVAARGRLLCGVGTADIPVLCAAARKWPGTRVAFGVHPWLADETFAAESDWLERVEGAVAADEGAWVGEIGLDGNRVEESGSAIQERVFRAQLELARQRNRPVNLHCVKAWDGLIRGLDESYLCGDVRTFILHAFSGPYQYLPRLTERGAYFSLGKMAARSNSRKNRERAALIPEDRLLLESDAFLSPGQDDAAGLRQGLVWLAGIRERSVDSLARQLQENAARIAL